MKGEQTSGGKTAQPSDSKTTLKARSDSSAGYSSPTSLRRPPRTAGSSATATTAAPSTATSTSTTTARGRRSPTSPPTSPPPSSSSGSEPRRRPRTRSRTDSYTRRHREQIRLAQAAGATTLLFVNVRKGMHAEVESLVRQSVPEDKLSRMLLDPLHSFGFVSLQDAETTELVWQKFNHRDVNGYRLSVEPCVAATPGHNPRVLNDASIPSDTLVIKNLAYNCSKEAMMEEMASLTLPGDIVDFTWREQTTSQPSGMAFLKFASVEDAEAACHELNGVSVLGRTIRVEFKRIEGAQAQTTKLCTLTPDSVLETYEPKDAQARILFENLKLVKAGELSTYSCFVKNDSMLAELKNMADAIGLALTVEQHPSGVRTANVWKLLSPRASRRTRSKSCSHDNNAQVRERSSSLSKVAAENPITETHIIGGRRSSSFSHSPAIRNEINTSRQRARSIASKFVQGVVRQPKGPDGTHGFRRQRSSQSLTM